MDNHKFSKLTQIMVRGKEIVKELKVKYPSLQAYPVFSSRYGQSGFSTPEEIVFEFPKMFLPEDTIEILHPLLKLKKNPKKKIDDIQSSKIENLLQTLTIKEDVFLELRFLQLDYELIARLKKDPLVHQGYTIREPSGIAIVLFRVNEILLEVEK